METHHWAHQRDFARAAEVGIRGLEYCNALRRGGRILDAIISNACASPILQQLNRIRTDFSANQRRHLVAELGRIEAERESFATIEERDQKWKATTDDLLPDFRAVDRLMDDLEASYEIFVDENKKGAPIADLRARMKEHYLFVYGDELSAPIEEQRARMKQVYFDDRDGETIDAREKRMALADMRPLSQIRMLAVDLMLRSFKDERGHYPDNLDQLTVPGGMACLRDPLTGQHFIYRRELTRRFLWFTKETFVLFSPGPMLYGQEGTFGSWSQISDGVADLCLDWANYETSEWS